MVSNDFVSSLARRILSILMAEMPLKQAVAIATALTDGHRKSLYQLALELKSERHSR